MVSAVLLLGACSTDDAGGTKPDRGTAPAADGGDAGGGNDAAPRGPEEDAGGGDGVLGTANGELPDWNETRMVPLGLAVTELARNGELVELQMTLTVAVEPAEAGDDFRFNLWTYLADTSDTEGEGYDVSGVRLIDQEGQAAYLPAVDSQGVCACTGDLGAADVPPGESVELSATFGGVPGDVEQVDVHLPGFSPVEGVGIDG